MTENVNHEAPGLAGPVIQGAYRGFNADKGTFDYVYACPCGKRFLGTAPEPSAPAPCHWCYTGEKEDKRRRAAYEARRIREGRK